MPDDACPVSSAGATGGGDAFTAAEGPGDCCAAEGREACDATAGRDDCCATADRNASCATGGRYGNDTDDTVPHGLVLVSTPIGNLGDMTARGIAALRGADLVLCEDTRVTTRLFAAAGIATRREALHDHNEDSRIPGVLARLREGRRIALVSDAGTPVLSDPGFRLVRAVIAAGLPVTAVPGPNAAVTALILSGLPPAPFLFLGFAPPREAARRAAFGRLRAAEQAGLSCTMIWHEAPHRLAGMLADLAQIFGPRPAAVARELTKRFEEVARGTLSGLAARYADAAPRGEITLVMGPPGEAEDGAADLDGALRVALQDHSVKDAAALVATASGLPRRLVYARALALGREAGAVAGASGEAEA